MKFAKSDAAVYQQLTWITFANALRYLFSAYFLFGVFPLFFLQLILVIRSNKCQEKTGGKVVHRVGGIVFLFRGRYYDTRTRPRYPTMLWKPAAPVYPKLIQQVPEGLTREEAVELREKGEKLPPICKLGDVFDSC